MNGRVRLWLARHGATLWTEAGRITGWTDPDLSRSGRAQAMALGGRLRGRAFDAVWSSDLRRATETAAIVCRSAGLSRRVGVDHRLRELRFGALEGTRWVDLAPELRAGLLAFDGFRAPSGESVEELRSRVRDLLETFPAGDHLVVTHGGVIRMLLREAGLADHAAPGSVVPLDLTSRSI